MPKITLRLVRRRDAYDMVGEYRGFPIANDEYTLVSADVETVQHKWLLARMSMCGAPPVVIAQGSPFDTREVLPNAFLEQCIANFSRQDWVKEQWNSTV